MENQHNLSTELSILQPAEESVLRKFMANVFSLMFVALGISALFAYIFASNYQLLLSTMFDIDPQNGMHLNILGWLVLLAPIGFVLLMSFGYSKLSAPALTVLLILYSAINGISLSFILLVYAAGSVLSCFLASAVMFGIMAVAGYRTSQDLTKFGRILFMGLIGIVVASLINLFMGNSTVDYIISFVGVMIFTGLTAYDVQKLKNIGSSIQEGEAGTAAVRKVAVMGALNLYLDFINLFLMLLRLFGKRN